MILVTGRELPELESVFPEYGLCDAVVAENGGLFCWPGEAARRFWASRRRPRSSTRWSSRGVQPFSVGKVIFATWRPHESVGAGSDSELGHRVSHHFQQAGGDGAAQRRQQGHRAEAVLKRLQISPHHVVGIGDAENDHAFLESCAVAVAVDNALPALKERCDLVTDARSRRRSGRIDRPAAGRRPAEPGPAPAAEGTGRATRTPNPTAPGLTAAESP